MTALDSALRKAFAAQPRTGKPEGAAEPSPSPATTSPSPSLAAERHPQTTAFGASAPSTGRPTRTAGQAWSHASTPLPLDTPSAFDPYSDGPQTMTPAESESVGLVRQRIRRRTASIRRPMPGDQGSPYGPSDHGRSDGSTAEAPALRYAASTYPGSHHLGSLHSGVTWGGGGAHEAGPWRASGHAIGTTEATFSERIRDAVAAELSRQTAFQRENGPAIDAVGGAGSPHSHRGVMHEPGSYALPGAADRAVAEETFDVVRRQGEELSRIINEVRQREQSLSTRESDLSRREQGLADQESRLAVLRSTLDRRAEDLLAREATLAERERTLRTAADRLAKETETLALDRAELTARRTALDDEAGRLEAARTELDVERTHWKNQRSELASHEQQLAATRRNLAVQSKALAANEVELNKLRIDVQRQQAELKEAKDKLAVEQTEIRSKTGEIDKRTEEIQRRATDLAERAEQVGKQVEELARREAELQSHESEMKSQHTRLRQREAELKLRQSALQQRESDLKDQERALRTDLETCEAQQKELIEQETKVQAQQSDLEQRAAVIRQQQEVLLTQLSQVTTTARPESDKAVVGPTASPTSRGTSPPESDAPKTQDDSASATQHTAAAQPETVSGDTSNRATAATGRTSAVPSPSGSEMASSTRTVPDLVTRLTPEELAVLTGRSASETAPVVVADATTPEHQTAPTPAALPASETASRGESLVASIDPAGTHRLDPAAESLLARPHSARVGSPTKITVAAGVQEIESEFETAASPSARGFAEPSALASDVLADPTRSGHEMSPGIRPEANYGIPVRGGQDEQTSDRTGRSHAIVEPPITGSMTEGLDGAPSGGHQDPPSDADLASIRSLWEVDHWEWPAVVASVAGMLGSTLDAAGSRLLDEARNGRKIWAIGSIGQGCGATTVATCLARWAGRNGVETILIDANFASPDLATQFDLGTEVCWSETLRGAQPWGESTITSLGDHVTLAPLVEKPNLPSTASLARRMDQALATLRGAYDLILVDVAAFSEPDALELAGCFDAALIVSDGTAAQADRCRQTRQQLKAMGLQPVFFVENRIDG